MEFIDSRYFTFYGSQKIIISYDSFATGTYVTEILNFNELFYFLPQFYES